MKLKLMKNSKPKDLYTAKNIEVVLDNDFAKGEFSRKFTTLELKLMYLLISQSKKGDNTFYSYRATFKELSEALDMNKTQLYDSIGDLELEELCVRIRGLDSEEFRKRKNRRRKDGIPVFSRVTLVSDDDNDASYVEFKLNRELKPFVLNLKGNFVKYGFVYVKTMKKKHSIRLQTFLAEELKGRKEVEVSMKLNDMKRLLGVPLKGCSYDSFGMFNDRVLKPSVKEINSKSFFSVDMGFMKKQGTKSVESILMYVRRDS